MKKLKKTVKSLNTKFHFKKARSDSECYKIDTDCAFAECAVFVHHVFRHTAFTEYSVFRSGTHHQILQNNFMVHQKEPTFATVTDAVDNNSHMQPNPQLQSVISSASLILQSGYNTFVSVKWQN